MLANCSTTSCFIQERKIFLFQGFIVPVVSPGEYIPWCFTLFSFSFSFWVNLFCPVYGFSGCCLHSSGPLGTARVRILSFFPFSWCALPLHSVLARISLAVRYKIKWEILLFFFTRERQPSIQIMIDFGCFFLERILNLPLLVASWVDPILHLKRCYHCHFGGNDGAYRTGLVRILALCCLWGMWPAVLRAT